MGRAKWVAAGAVILSVLAAWWFHKAGEFGRAMAKVEAWTDVVEFRLTDVPESFVAGQTVRVGYAVRVKRPLMDGDFYDRNMIEPRAQAVFSLEPYGNRRFGRSRSVDVRQTAEVAADRLSATGVLEATAPEEPAVYLLEVEWDQKDAAAEPVMYVFPTGQRSPVVARQKVRVTAG